MIKIYVSCILSYSIFVNISLAQDDYQKWLEKDKESYFQYLSEEDKKFADFLKKEWVQSTLSLPEQRFDKPKKPIPNISPGEKKEIQEYKSEIMSDGKSGPNAEIQEPESSTSIRNFETAIPDFDLYENNSSSGFYFYGSTFKYYFNENLKVYLGDKINKEAIADYWIKMNSKNYKACLSQAEYYKNLFKYNDWGYLNLLYSYSKILYPNHSNERNLFCWFMLIKSGYLARVGFFNDRIGLFIGTKEKLYGKPYYSQKNIEYRFYNIVLNITEPEWGDDISIYKEDYTVAKNPFEFKIETTPLLSEVLEVRKINFHYLNDTYNIDVTYNRNIIEYFREYPFADFIIYFSSPPSQVTERALLDQFQPIINNKSEIEALNILLRFVQYATEYKTDQEQFNREKPLFVDESIYYPYSDCEDRAVLFSYLVRKILGLDVIGLDYPDHISTAVKCSADQDGSFILYKGEKYLMCDPTYIDASAGKVMPGYENQKYHIIDIQSSSKSQ